MYNHLYEFLESKNLKYDLQFGFWQKHSTSHSLIHLTDKLREQLGKGKFGYGIFANFQKAFNTFAHNILIKLNYYGVRGKANNWDFLCLENRTPPVSINSNFSGLHFIRCGEPQGFIWGPCLFLIYKAHLHCTIKYYMVHHFEDDPNLLNFSHSIKKMNKKVNYELKNLSSWLNANKICRNVSKIEIVFLNHQKK